MRRCCRCLMQMTHCRPIPARSPWLRASHRPSDTTTQGMMRSLFVVTSLLWCAGITQAHDLITSESAVRYLAQAQQRLEVVYSRQPPAQRAESAFALGRMLDEIRDLLNRDVAAHGRIQGLSTEYLVRELKRKGLTIELSPAL